jgi:hypothetical protein
VRAGAAHVRAFSWQRVALEHERLYARVLYQTSRRWIATHEDPAHA